MIPDHIISKALDAWIGDHNCPHPDQISVYRVLITRSLEAVAAELYDEGYEYGRGDGECMSYTRPAERPYRASETA